MTDEVIVDAAAAAQPAPQPAAAAPAPAPAPAPEVKAGDVADAPFEYAEVEDDPGLTMALKFVGNLGITPDHPAMAAALQGDFGLLSAHLAALGPKATGHEAILNLAKQSWERHVANETSAREATREAVFSVVGGEEQWTAIKTWADANADPAEQEAINGMFKAGGLQAKMAAEFLRNRYSESTGAVVEPKSAVSPAQAAAPASNGGAISPAEFQAELTKLTRQYGARGVQSSPEYKALSQRRVVG